MTSDVAPWTELVALARRERELALDGHWDEVAASSAERVALAESLGNPPEEARDQLERLNELQAQITALVSTARAFTVRELGELRRGHAAMSGYGATAGIHAGMRVDDRG